MTEHRHFDETLISGHLDGELTQADDQKVRIHLEDCDDCRRTAQELVQLKETTMTTEFKIPDDTQWDETPRGAASGFLRNFGWLIAIAWLVGIVGYAIWQIATETEDLIEVVLVFGLWLGFGLVFLSALIDRLKIRKTDPYRKVDK